MLASVKAFAAALVDREELKLAAIAKSRLTKEKLAAKIGEEEHAAEMLEQTITKHYTAFVAGKITLEDFLSRKDAVNAAIAERTAKAAELREQLEEVTSGKSAAEETLTEIKPLLTIEKLDRELVDLVVDKIIVYDEQRIEIVWNGRFERG